MDERGMIERKCASEMWKIQEWREDEDGLCAVVGRAEVLEDDEEAGLYSGDAGELTVSVVGAEEYGNQRAHVGFTPDEYDGDGAVEVRDLGTIELL